MILGSKSKRREEIFSRFHLPFEIIGSNFNEREVPFQGFPVDYVQTIAVEKSRPLADQYPGRLILTADTTVACEGKIYNKPETLEEAREMLKALSGQKHEVLTGVCIRRDDEVHEAAETTHVQLNTLSDEQINTYIQHVDVLDKAGSYAIQGLGSLLVKSIDGCFYNVMGLPINTTQLLLQKMGINLWDSLARASSQSL